MKVLVTGGGGYIGSTLVRLLLKKGYNIRVLDRFFFGMEPLQEVESQIEIVKDDIRWVDSSIFNGIDVVIDMAALSNDPVGELDQSKTLEINHIGRVRIAKMAKKQGVKKYILASSCSVYGFQDELLDEKSKTDPLTTYAKANLLWEKEVMPLANDNFCVTALRQATVYGVSYKMRFDLAINGMILGFFKNGKIPLLRDGNQWRPFIHVKDACKAFISVIEAKPDLVSGEIFNVGSNEQNYQISPLAELIAKSLDVPFKYEWYGSTDKRSYRVNFDKIKKVLKFKPDFTPKEASLEIFDSLKNGNINPDDKRTKTVEWYKHLLESDLLVKNVSMKGTIL